MNLPKYLPECRFRHCVVASTTAFEAVSPGSIPGGGANEVSGATRKWWGAERSHQEMVGSGAEPPGNGGEQGRATAAAEQMGGYR